MTCLGSFLFADGKLVKISGRLLGARLTGHRTGTQRSKFWEAFWGRVLRRGPAMGFAVKKGSEKGSQKEF